MRPSTDDAAFLWDMLDAARAVGSFVASRAYQDYLDNRMLRGAVERHLEILAEAARRVSRAVQEDHPEVPWRRIIGLRNVLAHEYGEIKHDKMWIVATEAIPALIDTLESLVPPAPDSQQP